MPEIEIQVQRSENLLTTSLRTFFRFSNVFQQQIFLLQPADIIFLMVASPSFSKHTVLALLIQSFQAGTSQSFIQHIFQEFLVFSIFYMISIILLFQSSWQPLKSLAFKIVYFMITEFTKMIQTLLITADCVSFIRNYIFFKDL